MLKGQRFKSMKGITNLSWGNSDSDSIGYLAN